VLFFLLTIITVAGAVLACSGSGGASNSGGKAVDDDDDSSPDDDDDNDDSSAPLNCRADGTVCTDPATGLMWQNGPTVGARSITWQEAKNYCAELSWGGFGGWRLPDIDELRSFIRGCPPTVTGGSCSVTDECLSYGCWNDTCGCGYGGGPGPGCSYWPAGISGELGSYPYWSSSTVAQHSHLAWWVQFGTGEILGGPIGVAILARCVR
jgi:hypothetical protein